MSADHKDVGEKLCPPPLKKRNQGHAAGGSESPQALRGRSNESIHQGPCDLSSGEVLSSAKLVTDVDEQLPSASLVIFTAGKFAEWI